MAMRCEKCGKEIAAAEGEYILSHDSMVFACRDCARKLNEEAETARKVCAAVDGNRTRAEYITSHKDAFETFLKNIETTLKKVPGAGTLLADIPLLVSLVKSYVDREYTEIPYNSIVAVVAALLYVISPIDIIPDFIPVVGFADDAVAVGFCIKMIHDDLEKYKSWRDGTQA